MMTDEGGVFPSDYYSLNQQKALVITPVLTGVLSMLGSSAILNIILRDRRQKLQFTYYRIIMIMSIIDILFSLSMALGAVANPRGVVWGAIGNTFTCSLHGFLVLFANAVPIYNTGGLCVYYLLVIRYKKSQKFVARFVEPLCHAIALGIPLIYGITAWSLDSINPLYHLAGTCFINAYPPRCTTRDNLECTRGSVGTVLLAEIAVVSVFVPAVTIMLVTMFIIIRFVRREENAAPVAVSGDRTASKSRQTQIQALLYCGAFFITYTPTIIKNFYGVREGIIGQFIIAMLFKIFQPLQGFFNCIIFIRPRDLNGLTAAEEASFAPEISGAHQEDESIDTQSLKQYGNSKSGGSQRESVRDRAIRQGMESVAALKKKQATALENQKESIDSVMQMNVLDDDDSLLQDDDEEMAIRRKIFFSY